MYLLLAGYSMISSPPPFGSFIWLKLVPSAYISRMLIIVLKSSVPCNVVILDRSSFCILLQSASVSPVIEMITLSSLLPSMSSFNRFPRTTMVPETFFLCQSPMLNNQLAACMAFCWSALPPRSMVILQISPALVRFPCTMDVPFAMAGYISKAGVIS